MRIGITNPTTWPWVLRGGERFINELARYLAGRGHEVMILAAKPGAPEVRHTDGYTTVCQRRLWHPSLARMGLLEFHAFFPVLLPALLRRRFDAILCCTFLDTYAATLARKLTGTPCVFWVNSPPPKIQYFRSLSLGGRIIRRAMRDADEVIALSAYMNSILRERYGREGLQIPVPVDTDLFVLSSKRDPSRPTILCAAALGDRRKGGPLLMRAFDRLKPEVPEARLRLVGPVDEAAKAELLRLVSEPWRGDVEFLPLPSSAMPAAFGEATLSVLPSLWEGFGMVVVESLATGTPVVGTRDGAIPEILNSLAIGRLFDPGEDAEVEPTNLEGLVQALREGLKLSRDPATAGCCRRRAEELSWKVNGPRFEDLFERLAASAKLRRNGRRS